MHKIARFIWNHPLGRLDRKSALQRCLRWQLASRIGRWPVVVPFVNDTVLVVEQGMTGATGNIYCGLHESSDMGFVLHYLRQGDTFLDVGANVGSYTILAAGAVGAKTIAMEPTPWTFSKLMRNIQANRLFENVTALECAAGENAGELTFSTDRTTKNTVVDEGYAGESKTVKVMRIDDVVTAEPAILWKIDVEGFEQSVLAGAEASLEDTGLQAILIESDEKHVVDILQRHNFQPACYDPVNRVVSLDMAHHKRTSYGNHLWLRDAEDAQRRCTASKKYQINEMTL